MLRARRVTLQGSSFSAPAKAVQLYTKAIDGGYVGAMYNLDDQLRDGAEKVSVTLAREVQLYTRAINERHVVLCNIE